MISWKIRPYEHKDYDAVCEILSDGLEYQQSVNGKSSYQEETLAGIQDDLLNNPKNSWWVALDGERVIGIMSMEVGFDSNNFRQRCVLVREIDVHKEYLRRGVGAYLIEYAEYFAISRDIALLSVRTHYGNATARDFYLSQGFCISDIPAMYGSSPGRAASFHKWLPVR